MGERSQLSYSGTLLGRGGSSVPRTQVEALARRKGEAEDKGTHRPTVSQVAFSRKGGN
jgi:hypothetical protein